jgi:predicted phage terminase large subunit-like protein
MSLQPCELSECDSWLRDPNPQIDAGIDAALGEKELREFVRLAWPILEPSTDFVSGWHLDAIAEHLTAVNDGQIRNLVINMPPRHMKSLAVSVFWPVWTWLRKPEARWLFSSYALALSIRDSLKCRRLIESPWFQERWGDRFALTSDQNAKMRFENDRMGYRIATSVGGAATGEGGDVVVVDDPHNVQEKESDTIREATLVWWDETMSTRLNDQKTGAKVIVMQRVHERDLAGHVLAQGGYEHLNLPAEFEPGRSCVTSIGWSDPRQRDGELLWPQRIGTKEITELKLRLGPTGYAGQFQQRPVPAGGAIFKADWFATVNEVPALARTVRGWDKAATEEASDRDPDWTAGVKIGVTADGTYYITDARRTRSSALGVERFIATTAASDGLETRIRLEQEPGSSGKGEAERYTRDVLRGYAVKALPSTGDKATRAAAFASAAEAGRVKLLKANWNDWFIDELTSFPKGAHDDAVDAASNAFNELMTVAELESEFFMASSG